MDLTEPSMRKILITAAMFFAATPAFAQPADEPEPPLPSHRTIDAAAGAVDHFLGALMSLPIGDLAAAVDPYGRTPYGPGTTVRDLARRGNPYAEAEMHAAVRGAAQTAHVMTGAIARATPVLRRSLIEMERSLAAAIDEANSGR
jgi:hypothetical protein